ncbi:MAG: heme ABC transporter ATP-binding protein [Gemmatimonadota bacterium]|nr:MAG: heme ABC transporter ATP-binding protein [Gemmatimonadota bacterium]
MASAASGRPPEGNGSASEAVAAFSAESLTARYDSGGPDVLTDVTMEVPAGSLYAVLGPNGSGKSTLMRILMGTLGPIRGSARVAGREVSEWNRRELARQVGAVAQSEAQPFPMTVRELVSMGRYPHLGPFRPEGDEDRAAVSDALERCDAAQLAPRYVSTLSGGEFQRVRIARALAQNPRSLALDEPTASLDIRHEMSILQLLRESADSGLTVLLITHHLNLAARFADRMLLLSEGSVAAQGSPEEVLREGVLGEVYGWPVAVRPDPVSGAPSVTPLG